MVFNEDNMKLNENNIIYIIYNRLYKRKIAMFIPFVYFVSIGLLIIVTFFTKTFFGTSTYQGFIKDFAAVFGMGIVGLPFLCIYTVYFTNNISVILGKILKSTSIKIKNENKEEIKTRFYKRVSCKKNNLVIIPAILTNLAWIYIHLNNDSITWLTYILSNGDEGLTIGAYIYIFINTIFFYALGYIIINFTAITRFMMELANASKVIIKPLHPDSCGGLSDVGRLAYLISLPMLIVGMGLVLMLISNVYYMDMPFFTWYHIFLILIYLIVSSIFFLMPIFKFKNAIQKSKYKGLKKISGYYSDTFNTVIKSKKYDVKNRELLASLDAIKATYNEVESMPVWPLNVKVLRKFLITTVSPFTGLLIPVFSEYLLQVIT